MTEDLWQRLHSYMWKQKDEKCDEIHVICDLLSGILDTRPNKSVIERLLLMTLYCRNIFYGLGQRKLTYAMILVWYKHYPILAVHLASLIVKIGIGSWRDMVGLSAYILERKGGKNHPFIQTIVEMMNTQLHEDWTKVCGETCSNVAKWIPRENSQYGWLFGILAMNWAWTYSPHILRHAKTEMQFLRATSKCKQQYRKIFASLTRRIDPVEVKQCSGKWSDIDPSKVTFDAMQKYRSVFFRGEDKKEDRIISAEKFQQYYSVHNTFVFRNPNRDLSKYVQDAIDNIQNLRIPIFMCKKDAYLPILCCNTHIFDPLFLNAIGYAYLLSTRSTLGRRIMFAGHHPVWINLGSGSSSDFVSSIQTIIQSITADMGVDLGFEMDSDKYLNLAMSLIPLEEQSAIKFIILGKGHIIANRMEEIYPATLLLS